MQAATKDWAAASGHVGGVKGCRRYVLSGVVDKGLSSGMADRAKAMSKNMLTFEILRCRHYTWDPLP